MALKPLLSFSSGELDPILHDNVTLEKFNKGLNTARNVIIGKTGSIISRFSTEYFVKARYDNVPIRLFAPPFPDRDVLLEIGAGYIRVRRFGESIPVTDLTAASIETSDLPKLQFTVQNDLIFIFIEGKETVILWVAKDVPNIVLTTSVFFNIPNAPYTASWVVNSATGYRVDYLVTLVVNNQESLGWFISNSALLKPITVNSSIDLQVKWKPDARLFQPWGTPVEMRVYQRPHGGGAFGYLGSSSKIIYDTPNLEWVADFQDLGSLPDYTNGPPEIVTLLGLDGKAIHNLKSNTGTIYQQRLIVTDETDKEALIASRPGHSNNFYRDFPYDADSALKFKSGTGATAKVLRMIESDGLIVFTTDGVYTSFGVLSINNLALERRGSWIIKNDVPPLVVPGGIFFVDRTNVVRQLIFSQDIQAYESLEQSIFSNHLFRTRTIKSWTYYESLNPVIIVSFSDGTFATFTYNYEHQMRAWTRHDSRYPIEQVEATRGLDRCYFVVNKNGNRFIDVSLARRISIDETLANPDSDKSAPNFLMDSIHTSNGIFTTQGTWTLTPVVAGEWDGPLTLTSSLPYFEFFLEEDLQQEILRWFHPKDKNSIDFEVLTRVDDNSITIQPDEEFPSEFANGPQMYFTFNIVVLGTNFGVSKALTGEKVSVVVDGYVIGSPNNDVEGYEDIEVEDMGGFDRVVLPDGLRGAIVHVGRPLTADVKTLNVSTLEQSPTLIESLTTNKVYIKVQDTRGLYVSNDFPEEKDGEKDGSSVKKMENLDKRLAPINQDLVGNRYNPPVSTRHEVIPLGSWKNQGQVSIRQVDPLHFEIISIIPDIQLLNRSDR
jgi:hypothetical protein